MWVPGDSAEKNACPYARPLRAETQHATCITKITDLCVDSILSSTTAHNQVRSTAKGMSMCVWMRGCAIAASHAGTCQHDKLKHPAAVAKLESGVQLILI
jgi:hypothetical protein